LTQPRQGRLPGFGKYLHDSPTVDGMPWIVGGPSSGSEIELSGIRKYIMMHLPIGAEHRWGERVRVDLRVDVLEEGRSAVGGCLQNLSLSGALLKLSLDLHLRALIGVRIERPSPSTDSCVAQARISRKPAHGIGIEWCDFAPAVVKDLLRLPWGRYSQ